MEKFIKLNKKLLNWKWYKDVNTKVLFIHFLLKADSEDIDYKDKLSEKGIILTTISKLVEDLGLSRQNIKTSIKKLESTGEIEIKSTKKYKIIKVINYDYYQEEKNIVDTNHSTNYCTNHKIICKQDASKLDSKPDIAISKTDENNITNHSNNQSSNHSNKQRKEERKEAKERIKEIYIYNYNYNNINKYNNNKYNNINKYNNNNKYNNINDIYNYIYNNNKYNNNIYKYNNNISTLKLRDNDMEFKKTLQKSSLKENTEDDLYIIKKIIDYLNLKVQTRYKYKSSITQTRIKARLREGYKLEDFVEVIDKKCEDWLNDEKMEKYLRPETLFSNKFESYLNQKNIKDLVKIKEKNILGGTNGKYRGDIEKEKRYDQYKDIKPIDLSKIF